MERTALVFQGNHQSEPLHCPVDLHARPLCGAQTDVHTSARLRARSVCVYLISI